MNTDPSRFDRVEEHPDFPRMIERAPVLPADANLGIAIAGPAMVSLFGAVCVAIALNLFFDEDAPVLFVLLFLAAALAIIFAGLSMASRALRFKNAPIQRCVAVIVKDRSEVVGGESSTSTSYFATLQLRGGSRVELPTYGSLAGRLVIGDIGIAFVKSQTLVDFTRFDIE
jgi:hypothetical protein